MSESETEQSTWQATTREDELRRKSAAAWSDVQRGAVAGGFWGFTMLGVGLFEFLDAGPLLRAYWAIAAGAAALKLSTEQTRAAFASLAMLALAELTNRVLGLRDALLNDDLLTLLFVGMYVAVLPVVVYTFVEACRAADYHEMPGRAATIPDALIAPAILKLCVAGLYGLTLVTTISYSGGGFLRGLSEPGAELPRQEDVLAEIGRGADKLKALDTKRFREEARGRVEAAAKPVPKVDGSGAARGSGSAKAVPPSPGSTERDGSPVSPPSGQPVATAALAEAARPAPRPFAVVSAGEAADDRRAAEQGDAVAQNRLGLKYDQGLGVPQDYAEALVWYRRSADRGNAEAQNNLGFMYGNGRGVARDDAAALQWYRRAADQGNADAENNLGFVYGNGRGVARDDAAALEWYRKAAEQGNATAQFNLGSVYSRGRGTAPDLVRAHQWLNLAAAQGDAGAAEARDAIASQMTPEQIAEAQKLAREWKPAQQAD